MHCRGGARKRILYNPGGGFGSDSSTHPKHIQSIGNSNIQIFPPIKGDFLQSYFFMHQLCCIFLQKNHRDNRPFHVRIRELLSEEKKSILKAKFWEHGKEHKCEQEHVLQESAWHRKKYGKSQKFDTKSKIFSKQKGRYCVYVCKIGIVILRRPVFILLIHAHCKCIIIIVEGCGGAMVVHQSVNPLTL